MGIPERQLMIDHDKQQVDYRRPTSMRTTSMRTGPIDYGPGPRLRRFRLLRKTTGQKNKPVQRSLTASHGPVS